MTYAAARAWLDGFINLERRSDPAAWTTIKLERVARLAALLGDPQLAAPVVHIAGSKGKGSTAAMIDRVLRAAGRRVGLYTSPDLVSRRERLRVDGAPIPEADVANLVAERLRPAAEAWQGQEPDEALSFFDLHTVMAFEWFARCGVDWMVIEVGLGGRLDATNIVAPAVCAITSLSLEHTQFLGHTLAAIAGEKAGIIKPGVPVVTASQPPEAAAVLARVAAERGAPLLPAEGVAPRPGEAFLELPDGRVGQGLDLDWAGTRQAVKLPLLGAHQAVNAAVARTVLAIAAPELPAATVVAGFESVQWPGRLQVLERRPWLVLDGAHTPESAQKLSEALALFPHARRWLVLGSARDKDLDGVLAALAPGAAGLVVTGIPGHPRAAGAEELLAVARRHHDRAVAAADPGAALALAADWAAPEDLIVVTGSLYLVGAVLALRQGDEPV